MAGLKKRILIVLMVPGIFLCMFSGVMAKDLDVSIWSDKTAFRLDQGEKLAAFLNMSSSGFLGDVDIHIAIISPGGAVFEWPDWNGRLVPVLEGFSVSADFHLPDTRIFEIAVKENGPLFQGTGTYFLAAAVFSAGTYDLAADISLFSFQVNSDGRGVYIKEPDLQHIITSSKYGGAIQLPVNQIILDTQEDVSREKLSQMLDTVGGRIVGQIPELSTYQIEVDTATEEELETKISQIAELAGILDVTPNYFLEPYGMKACTADDDNGNLKADQRTAFENSGYYQLVPIFEKIKEHTQLSPVRVGIQDSGVDGYPQFNGVNLKSMDGSTFFPFDTHGHGTAVAGIIGASNGDGSINGIASGLLENRFSFYVGWGFDIINVLRSIYRTRKLNIDVFNLSLGRLLKQGPREKKIRSRFKKFLKYSPDTLFCVAAGNSSTEITTDNAMLSGIQLPNVINVGGTDLNPLKAWEGSNYGSLIDIAGPAVGVARLDPNNPSGVPLVPLQKDNGTSVAAPFVTAVAALIKSIAPQFTPEQIKNIIKKNSWPTDEKFGGAGRLCLPCAIEQAAIDADISDSLNDLFDRDKDRQYDAPGIVVSRICSDIQLSIQGYVNKGFSDTNFFEDRQLGTAVSGSFGLTVTDQTDLVEDVFGILVPEEFRLGQSYALSEENFNFVRTHNTMGPLVIGTGKSGNIVFDDCCIIGRWPDNNPSLVQMQGQMGGSLLIGDFEKMYFGDADVNLKYLMPIGIAIAQPQPFYEYFENNCIGGKGFTGREN